jgi:hypothetical protein
MAAEGGVVLGRYADRRLMIAALGLSRSKNILSGLGRSTRADRRAAAKGLVRLAVRWKLLVLRISLRHVHRGQR